MAYLVVAALLLGACEGAKEVLPAPPGDEQETVDPEQPQEPQSPEDP